MVNRKRGTYQFHESKRMENKIVTNNTAKTQNTRDSSMDGKVKVVPLQESSKNLSVGKSCSPYPHIFNKTEVAHLPNQKQQ